MVFQTSASAYEAEVVIERHFVVLKAYTPIHIIEVSSTIKQILKNRAKWLT